VSGLLSFDPDAHLVKPAAATITPIERLDEMPAEWRAGIQILEEMAAPHGATTDRWAQIVQDAVRFAWWCHADAIAAEWTTGNIFGFDPDQPDGLHGLIFDIRGGRVIRITNEEATIRVASGWRIHHRRMPDTARPIWRLGRR
jgi:hypothetical protein